MKFPLLTGVVRFFISGIGWSCSCVRIWSGKGTGKDVGCFAHRSKANVRPFNTPQKANRSHWLQVKYLQRHVRVAMALGMYRGSVYCVRLRLHPSSPSSSLKSITIKLHNLLISYSGGLQQLLLCCFAVWLREGWPAWELQPLHLRAQNCSCSFTMTTSSSTASAGQAGPDASCGLNFDSRFKLWT